MQISTLALTAVPAAHQFTRATSTKGLDLLIYVSTNMHLKIFIQTFKGAKNRACLFPFDPSRLLYAIHIQVSVSSLNR